MTADGQNFEWAKRFGGLGLDTGREVTTDDDGNVFLVGSFSGSANIGGTNHSGYGSQEAFVAKLSPDGNVLWVNVISGSEEDLGRGAITDDEGSVYVVGHFTDTVVFDVTPTEVIGSGSRGGQDIFVVKFSATGQYQWHVTGGGIGDDTATDIDMNSASNKLYVCGGFENRGTFGSEVTVSSGDSDAFLLQINDNGTVQWVRHGGGDSHDVAASVAVDENSEAIYIVGDFYEQAEFDGTSLQSEGSSEVFLAKYDNDGNLHWALSNGGTNVDVATSVGTDENGKIYVSGYYQLTTNFQGFASTALGYNDVFLTQFDADGNCNWLTSAGSNGLDNCLGMAVASDGTTFLTGMFDEEMFAGSVSFEGDGYDIFILCHNPDGTVRYGRNAGAGSSDFGMATCLGPDQSLYLSGYYFFFSEFDDITLDIADNGDGFIAKMTDIINVETIEETVTNCLQFDVDNRCVRLNECAHEGGTWKCYDLLGRELDGGTVTNNCIPIYGAGSLTMIFEVTSGKHKHVLPLRLR